MIKQNVESLHGFAWYVHRLPGTAPTAPGECPYSGLDSRYRPLHWPIRSDMGSVAEEVLRRAPCPVLAVKDPSASRHREPVWAELGLRGAS